jgi:hypothetical protein
MVDVLKNPKVLDWARSRGLGLARSPCQLPVPEVLTGESGVVPAAVIVETTEPSAMLVAVRQARTKLQY